jgi:RecJ-like exonuclease
MRNQRWLVLMAVLLLSLVVSACPKQTTIAQINQDPAEFRDREVALRGEVVNSFGALGPGAYEVDDGTGRIWVITDRGVPSRGARVRLVGRVTSGVTVAGRTFGNVIRERDRELRSTG